MYFFLNLLYFFSFFVITTEVSLIISFIRLCISRSILEYREVYRLAIQGRPKVLPCPREPDGTPWMVHEVKNKQAKFYFPQTRFVKAPPLSGVDGTPSPEQRNVLRTFLDFWKVCSHG